MTEVLIATDSDAVYDEVDAALADGTTTVRRVRSGREVPLAIDEVEPDLIVLDLQIGNMGGIATCIHLRHEVADGRMPDIPIMLLLDRAADVMLAGRSGAAGWLVKPLDPITLRRTATAVLEGRSGDAQPSAEPHLAGDVNPL